MDTPRKEEDTVPPFLPAEDFSTGAFDLSQRDDHLLGTIVAGRYTVMHLLGSGGMGRVYEAFDAAEQREVAMKVLHADRVGSPAAVQRFMEEARVLSMLSHPNVVRLLDFGQDDSGVIYMVMEMLVGRDLGDHLAERRRLPWSEAAEISLQLVRGLSAAHDRGIVHRDLKPENVFMQQVPPGAAPRIKLLDFGIAKDMQSHNAKLTGEGSVFGTARYMSPEQASGSPVDARSDVYGVGILIYEMITGRPPFMGDDFMGTAHQHVTDPVPPLSEVAPDVPFHPLVEEMVMRALAKRREDRFASMFDFEAAIEGTTIESTMAIVRPRLPPLEPRMPPPEERTVIKPPPERPGSPMPVPQEHTAALPPPDFDDDFESTVIRSAAIELPRVPPPAPAFQDRTMLRRTAIPVAPPPEERTVIRAAPLPDERSKPRRPPVAEERTVIRAAPIGVAGTIVPLTQPPPSSPPPPTPMPPMPSFEEMSGGDTVAMQVPFPEPPRMTPPPPLQGGYAPPPPHATPLATPVVRRAAPSPAPFGAPPPPAAHASPSLGGLVGGPGAGGAWSGGGLAGLPMPAQAPREPGYGAGFGGPGLGDGNGPVFAREENAAFMPAHLAPTRLASPPAPARNISPEEALATPFRPHAWNEEPAAPEASWTGGESGELLLRPPQRETSRNLVVGIVILVVVGLGMIGLLIYGLTRETTEASVTRPHRATTTEQPRPVAVPTLPERELVIKDTEPPPKPKPKPEPEPASEPAPEPERFDRPRPSRPSRPRNDSGPVTSLSSAQIDAGFKKARPAIDTCAKKNGALEGTSLQVSFDVVKGRADNTKVQPPHGLTPLGRCVAAAVVTNARFATAQEPSRGITKKVAF
jgi:eukaryotic-like serine/threonine-protein kinase